jgi:Na+/melibiose symporter-like transporter
MDSRKFWYFARRWIVVAITTVFFAFVGANIKGAPWAIGAVLIGAVGFIMAYMCCFILDLEDPRNHQHGEPWER